MRVEHKRPSAANGTACRICGCTQFNACPGGCGWVHRSGELPLCTVCANFAEQLQEYVEMCHRVSAASLARLLVETSP
jgi:hypothetical protein